MAISDKLNSVKERLRGLLRREPKVMDAFGGDEGFDPGPDDDEDKPSLAPKIALAVSGVMLLSLVTLVGVVVMMGDEQAAQTGGTLAGLDVVEDSDMAASERSVERRPWLTPTDGGAAAPRRMGVGEPTPAPAAPTPAAPAQTAKVEPAKPADAVKAEPAKTEPAKTEIAKSEPAPAPAEQKPAETKVADAKTPETKPTEAKPAETKPAETTPVAAEPEEEKVAELPSLMSPALTAPGAPRRFDSADVGSATAGGRPRLNDPKLPPTDKISVGAPPPRFSAVAEIKPPPADAKAAKLAIVVEGLGLNRVATEAALTKLPPSVTLAFSPYARDLKRLMERAKARGHEVLIEVPMESKAFPAEDPGPLGLLTSLDPKDNQERLDTILKEAGGATGVFDGMGSKFRESQGHITEVLTKLKQQNLFYVQGRPGVRVGDTEIPSATTDVVIDERPFRAAVDARFDFAEKLAKYQGSAVAVMAARPVSFERLALWTDQLAKKGVTITPVSQVLVQ